jgi:hypothetical protein
MVQQAGAAALLGISQRVQQLTETDPDSPRRLRRSLGGASGAGVTL